jgi:HAD superfamily hydrolase (TIGR01509 family)
MKMPIKAAIFDMDGLIVDTEIVHSKSIEIVFRQYGVEPTYLPTGLMHHVGSVSRENIAVMLKQHAFPLDLDTYMMKRRAAFEELLKEKLTPLPGFEKLLQQLHTHGYKIALASSRVEKHIHLILDNLEITHYFDSIIGPSEQRRHKPSPDIYIHTLEALGLRPKEAVVFEDSAVGVLSAHAAGIPVIAVPNEYTKDQDFTRADRIVSSLEEVPLKDLQKL